MVIVIRKSLCPLPDLHRVKHGTVANRLHVTTGACSRLCAENKGTADGTSRFRASRRNNQALPAPWTEVMVMSSAVAYRLPLASDIFRDDSKLVAI